MPEASNDKSTRRTEHIGKYEILEHLATGGMGIVYKARDMDLNRLVALKVLPAEFAKQQTVLIRFQREARAAGGLRHENIVTIYDIDEADGTYFIALEYIEGTDLHEYITRKCKLDPEEARQIIIQAAHALAHAHEQGIVHRDIKPSNLLLMRKGNRLLVKLTDFGLAIRHENEAEFRLTRHKTTVGTIDYMSPEQARDSRSADIRSDIYSLGCTFYHMLAGVAPFARGSLPERIVQHMQIRATDVRKHNSAVPAYLAAIVARMLAKKPDERYQTPIELLHDLENPDAVEIPSDNGAAANLERSSARKRKSDPTQIIEQEGAVETEPRPRPMKPRRPVGRPSEDRDEDIDDEPTANDSASTATMDDSAPTWDRPKKKTGRGSPIWIFVTGGTVGLLGLVLIVALIFGGRPLQKDPEPEKKKPPPIVLPNPIDPPPPIDTSAAKMTAGPLPWPIMDTRPEDVDLAALRKEYYDPFLQFPEVPAGAPVIKVSRLASVNRSLADAFSESQPKQWTIIEIRDNGPIFVASLPALADRTILLRGGDGFRPLIVWDVPKSSAKEKSAAMFFSLTNGKLILEDVDFVLRWTQETPATVFALSGSDFYARNCTFSLGGKPAEGIALLSRFPRKKTSDQDRPCETWLKRCYVRGAGMVLLDSTDTPSAFLAEESLIVGHQHPLFRMRGRNDDEFALRCVRSTLVTGQMFLRWQAQSEDGSAPIIGRMLDTIVSRDDNDAPVGDMIHLAGVSDLTRMNWRAQNSVYAGWKQLLASAGKNISGSDLDGWHRQWFYSTGDRALPDNWPKSPPSELEDQPAETFLPTSVPEPAPIAYAALTGAGSTGFVAGWLSHPPRQWTERFYVSREITNIPAADFEAPPIFASKDGLYYGERLDLGKPGFDFGAHLTKMLQTYKPAPRVVVHLAGRGTYPTSPLRVKGVQHLVLYFESGKEPGSGATLEANAASIQQRAPLIDMAGGHLEVIGARMQLGDMTLVPALIRVQDASLTLTRSWLKGPLGKSTDTFRNLIEVSNTTPTPSTLLMRDNVLVSAKLLVYANENVRIRARNNLLVSLGNALRFDASAASAFVRHHFDHNTIAARQTLLTWNTKGDRPAKLTLVHANSNAFVCPFTGDDTLKPTLLRGVENWASHGRWHWQGRHNVYGAQLHTYFASFDEAAPPKQTLRDWQLVWGQAGEDNAATFSFPGKGIAIEGATAAALLAQLERLALPKQLRGDPSQAPPGADLTSLGILKKKG